jgi:hypothetical protein
MTAPEASDIPMLLPESVRRMLNSCDVKTSPFEHDSKAIADQYSSDDVDDWFAVTSLETEKDGYVCSHCQTGYNYGYLLKLHDGNVGLIDGFSGCLTYNPTGTLYVASDLEILADMVKHKQISTLDLKHAMDDTPLTMDDNEADPNQDGDDDVKKEKNDEKAVADGKTNDEPNNPHK